MTENKSTVMTNAYGTILKEGLGKILSDVGGNFSPHGIHIYFNDVDSSNLQWEIDPISNGKSFVNRSILGKSDGNIVSFLSCSLTTRNSYQDSLDKYEQYEQLIKTRRAQGKTPDDDDEEDIKKIPFPFKFQVPFPEKIKNLDISKIKSVKQNGLECKFPMTKTFDFSKDCYNDTIKFFSKLSTPEQNKYLGLAKLTDSTDMINVNYGFKVLERIIYVHDQDFDPNEFSALQAKVLSVTYGKIIIEVELFNLKGIHYSTVIQESYLVQAKL